MGEDMRSRRLLIAVCLAAGFILVSGLFLSSCERTEEPPRLSVEEKAELEPANPWPLFHDALGFLLYYDRDYWERAHARHTPDGLGSVVMYSKSHREVLNLTVEMAPEELPLPARTAERVESLSAELPRFVPLAEERVSIAGLEGRRLDYSYLQDERAMRVSEYHLEDGGRSFVLAFLAEDSRWEAFEPHARAVAASLRLTRPKTEPDA